MTNPWFAIPLEDYEGHMVSPSVGQAPMLGDLLAGTVHDFGPRSLALLGAAGGNGLERIAETSVERVVAVDINRAYLEACVSRFTKGFVRFEIACDDIAVAAPRFSPVELCFAGLLAEYVPIDAFVSYTSAAVAPGGRLVAVLQLPDTGQADAVTPTPFTSLQRLADVFVHVDPEELAAGLRDGGGFADVRIDDVVYPIARRFCRITAARTAAP